MSTANTLKRPDTDAHWARDVEQRLALLEQPTTSRVGEWVLSSPNGVLQATKPGETPLIFGGTSEVDGDSLKGFLTQTDLDSALAGLVGTDPVTGFLPGIGTLLSGWLGNVPILSQIIDMFPFISSGLKGLDGLTSIFTDITSLFGLTGGLGSGNPILGLVQNIPLIGGLFGGGSNFLGGLIPGLDASKIISGAFPISMITGLLDVGGKVLTSLLAVPNSVLTGLFNLGGSIFSSLIPGLDASKITTGSFPQTIVTGLVDTTAAAFGWLTGFFNAVTGQTQTSVDVSEASAAAAQLAESAVANAIAIAALQAQQDGSTNNGLFSSDDFERSSATDINGAAGVGFWAETYANTKSVNGFYMLDGHSAVWQKGSAPDNGNRARFRRTKPADMHTQTLYQKVTWVVGSFIGDPGAFSDNSSVRLRCRLNDADTQEVFVEIDAPGGVRFGYKNGGSETWVDGATIPTGAYGAGTIWTLVAGTAGGVRNFQLLKNGGQVHSWSDSGALSAATLGTNNGWGWGGYAGAAFGGAKRPADIGIITIADNTPAAILGTVLQAYRANVSGVSCSDGALPNGFFDTLELNSSDLTWNAATGEVTVVKTGTYDITVAVRNTATLTGGQYIGAGFNVNGTLKRQVINLISGSNVTTFGPNWGFINTSLYLTAGDVIRGAVITNITSTLVGDGAGTSSYLTVARAN